jgi:hypothetical protein
MTIIKCKCPECDLIFDAAAENTDGVRCPICDVPVTAMSGPAPEPISRPAPVMSQPPPQETAPRPVAFGAEREMESAPTASPPVSPQEEVAVAEEDRGLRLGAIVFLGALGACLLAGLVGSIVIVRALSVQGKEKSGSQAAQAGSSRSVSSDDGSSSKPATSAGSATVSGSTSESAASSRPAIARHGLPVELQEKVNAAVDKGREYLYASLKDQIATGRGRDNQGGVMCLLALTLLECDVSADDSVIQAAARDIRRLNEDSKYTYGLALAILFLDRLADPKDEDRIRTLALRLVAGQRPNGMWTYECNSLPQDEEKHLLDFLAAVDYDSEVLAGKGYKGSRADVSGLSRSLRKIPIVTAIQRGWQNSEGRGGGDNSNTQFGLLGLWIARRHGVPVQPSLAFVEHHFRKTQAPDGNWGYMDNEERKASMTCAGLLGLAVGRGIRADSLDQDDPAIERGMRFLSRTIEPDVDAPRGGGRIVGADSLGDLYYLWSLERVAMIYDLRSIGGKDWYRWAADRITQSQRGDGGWDDNESGLYQRTVTTSFALLVLKRVNVAKDLTTNLKKLLNVKDLEKANK